MDHLYLWRYSHPAGGRVVTLDRLTDAEALRIVLSPNGSKGPRCWLNVAGTLAGRSGGAGAAR